MASAIGATPAMTVSGAAAEMTVAATPTVPTESARRVVRPAVRVVEGSETEEVELAETADMATSNR